MDRSTQDSSVYSIQKAIDDFVNNSVMDVKPLSIGIGLVGHVDSVNGIWLHSLNIPISKSVPLAEIVGRQFNMPVALDNDVHAATLAELRLGAGKKTDNFIFMNVGTGISTGIVCDGRIIHGSSNCAGEAGHMYVGPGNDECICGSSGCLEPISSGGGMIKQAKSVLHKYPDSVLNDLDSKGMLVSSTIFQAAKDGDKLAVLIAQKAVKGLATALVSLTNLLNPEMIVFGGGVFKDMWLIDLLREYVYKLALSQSANALKSIQPSTLDVEYVGLLGSSFLAWDSVDGIHNMVEEGAV
jgi:glucokinase